MEGEDIEETTTGVEGDDHDDDDDDDGDAQVAEDGGDGGDAAGAAGNPGTAGNESVLSISAVSNLDSLYGLREIGREALCWELSSAKPGNGVEQIRDQSTDTYWQSDGVSQPHWIQVHFARRVAISHVCLYLDYNLDESYTPKHLSVQVGMTTHDLTSAIHPANTIVELNEPVGWCIIPLTAPPDPLDGDDDDDEEEDGDDNANNDDEDEEGKKNNRRRRRHRLVRTHLIQISIISMHQNGRDTHMRQVQLYGPRTATLLPGAHQGSFAHAADAPAAGEYAAEVHSEMKHQRSAFTQDFQTVAMSQFSVLR